MDNRLDFISKFKDQDSAINEMTKARKQFIEIDIELVSLAITRDFKDPAFQRQISLARTLLEQSLQHTIKALCLLHEDKS